MFRLTALLLAGLALLAPAARADAGWTWPVRGSVLTHYGNGSDPYAAGQHRGIDIGADSGAAVVAAAGGEVRYAGGLGSSGTVVSVRTADGRYDTSYLHLASVAVHKGQAVSAGDRLGTVGATGTRSVAAPHLHFGVRDAGERHGYHDPLAFLAGPPGVGESAPRAVPAPVVAPHPIAPAPAPTARLLRWGARAPAPAMQVLRASAPLTQPSVRPVPAPGLRGAAARGPAASVHPASSAARVTHPARAGRAVDIGQRSAPAGQPGLGPAAGSPRRPGVVAQARRASDGAVSAVPGSRLPWVLAAFGLLVAAACLRPTATRRGARRAGAQVRTWLRPLPGRG